MKTLVYYYTLFLILLGGIAFTWIVHEITVNKWYAFGSAMLSCIILWKGRKVYE